MKKKLFFFCCFCFSVNLLSQTVGITDFMRLNPYSNTNNPAYFIPYDWYVGVPGLANVNISFYNTSIFYKNLIKIDSKGIADDVTINKFLKTIPKNSWLNTEMGIEVFGFGFRKYNYFFTFACRLKVDASLKYSKSLFRFLLKDTPLPDNIEDIDYYSKVNLESNLKIYKELCFGFQGQILDNLYIGVRPKILLGLLDFKTNAFNAKFSTNVSDDVIAGNYNINLNAASVFPFYKKDSEGNIKIDLGSLFSTGIGSKKIMNDILTKNIGFAIDLGVVYRINQEFRVSASITDLGFIKWKSSALKISTDPNANSFDFSRINADELLKLLKTGSIDADKNKDFFNGVICSEINSYVTMLTSKIMIDGYFDVTPSNRFIIQGKGYILGKNFLPQLTLAYNGTFYNAIDVVVSYSMMEKSFANLGIGLGFRMGPAHLYFGTDNVLAAFSKNSKDVIAPINLFNASRVDFTVGLLVDFPFKAKVKEPVLKSIFKKKVKKDEDMNELVLKSINN